MSRAEPQRIEARSPGAGTGTGDSGASRSNASLLRATGSVAVATLTSRLTGFLRTVLLAAILGPAILSSFTVANTMPQQVSELVLGQVLASLVVPVLVRAEMEDKDRGQAFFERLFTLSVTVLGIALLLALIASPLLVGILVGDSEVNAALTQALVIMFLPQLMFYGLSALFSAVLNTRGVFKPGAWAPVACNVVQITTLVTFYLMPGELSLNPVEMGQPKLLVLGIGSTLGVILQAAIQLPAMRRAGIKLRFRWGVDDRLKHFGSMGVAIVTYVFISISGYYAVIPVLANTSQGGPAIYQYAWLILQLPYGVLGVALLTAVMPRLSRNAAEGNRAAVLDDLSVATRITMVALIPIVAFTTVFGPSIGRALFNFGQFDVNAANHLGTALTFSAFVLIPYAMVLIHLRVFYAQEKAWIPTYIVLAITVVQIVLSHLVPVFVDDPDRVVELVGTVRGIAYIAGAAMGWFLLHRMLGPLRLTNVTRVLLQTTAVSALVVLTIYLVMQLGVLKAIDRSGPAGALLYLAIAGVLSLTLIYALLALWRVPDVLAILAPLQRILGRFIPAFRAPAPSEPVNREPATPDTREMRLDQLEALASLRREEITAQLPRIADDIGLPYAGQSHVPRRADTRAENPTAGLRYRRRGAFAVTEDDSARPARHEAPETGRMPLPSADAPAEAAHQADAATPGGADDFADTAPRGPELIPGAVVAGGRYRLIEHHGGIRGLQFWQARDINLDRDVALTFVDSEQRTPAPERGAAISLRGEGPQSILSRTLRLGRVHSNGLARVLDVVRGSSGGIVVAEWVTSSSLADVAGTNPSAIGAAKAVRALAGAAEGAHRAGAALSIDHPDRVRISHDGHAYLAFPGTLSDASKESDVRGLGAVLYALLLQRWPLDDATGRQVSTGTGTVAGIRQADPDRNGNPVEPRDAKSDIPFEISAVATRTLEGGQGIRTAATVQQLLDQASVVDVKTDLLSPVRANPALSSGQQPALAASAAPGQHGPQGRPTAATPVPPKSASAGRGSRRPKNMPLLVIAACAVLLLLIIAVTLLFNSLTSGGDTQSSVGSLYTSSESSVPRTPAAPAPGLGVPVSSTDVSLVDFSAQGSDSTSNIANVLTGRSPSWKTDTYRSGPKFGNLKEGVGLMVTLDKAVSLTGGNITSPSAGSTVQVRTSNSPTVKSLDETALVWSGTLRAGENNFRVNSVAPRAKYVLVWITGLTKVSSSDWYTTINQVSFQGS